VRAAAASAHVIQRGRVPFEIGVVKRVSRSSGNSGVASHPSRADGFSTVVSGISTLPNFLAEQDDRVRHPHSR